MKKILALLLLMATVADADYDPSYYDWIAKEELKKGLQGGSFNRIVCLIVAHKINSDEWLHRLAAVERDACEEVTVYHDLHIFNFATLKKMAKDEKVCSAVKDFNAFYADRARIHKEARKDYGEVDEMSDEYRAVYDEEGM